MIFMNKKTINEMFIIGMFFFLIHRVKFAWVNTS